MKNFILILSILFSLNSYSQYTFELDLSLYNGAYTSVDFYRAGNSYPMTNTGGNIYSYTASLPPIPGLLTNCTYKFIVDGVSEHFSTLSSCLTISNNDTLRIINLNTTIPSIVCWESCSPCITAMPGCTDSTANNYNSIANVDDGSCEYNITFIVDMSETSSSFSTPEVNGTFNSWCGNCASMTDANNDSIWEVTIPLVIGNYEYKFSADNWNIQESLYEFDNCITGSAPYFNRQVNVNGNQILDTICWNRCYSCDTERNYYNATFKLDMSNVTASFANPEVNGTFNNWCGNCWVLDPQGNNIYSKSFNIDTSLHTFKFSADNWSIQENLDSTLSCVDLGFDSTGALQYVNRVLKLTSDTTIEVCWESCNPCITIIYGCKDSIAINYNPIATIDDSSCIYCAYGCTDILACNYDSLATCDDSSCLTIYGCTDSLACNYNSAAQCDDGSCLTVYGCMNSLACNYDSIAQCDDGSCLTIYGCTDSLACNYNSTAQCDDGSCLTLYGCMNPSAINYDSLANCSDSCIFPQVTFGCTDSLAINYNPTATIDDSSCIYCVYGCTDILACNYDSLATCDDGSCLTIYGCTDSLACNYNSTAQCDNGSCLTVYGCMNSLACNYDSIAQCDDGSCLTIYGCTDSLACNYNSTAQCDDGSCLTVYGCMNSLACNYDSTAQCDDGSCLTLFGCTDPLAYNFDSLTTCNDSSCIYEYNVTFQLDLREQTSISYTTPEINGTFNGWCGNCAQMTDVNNDSIWEITVAILEGTGPVSGVPGWEYKFSADNWNIQENLFSGDPCTFTSSGYTNRFINITKDTILDPVCWGSCNDCYVPQTSYNVTFQVDMANVSGFSVPEINGVFNEWCGSCWPMTDIDGDNIWEFTALIDTSIQEYKFSADNWTIQEDLDSNLSCILINYDSASPNGWGYVNRYLNINSDTLLEILCWNECDTCLSTTGFISNVNNHSYTIYPNPSTSIFYVKSSDKIDKIIVYDILNKKIFEKNDPAILQSFDISDINSNILFLEIYINDKVRRDKLIITK